MPQQTFTTAAAIERLIDASNVIQRRMGLKQVEDQRVGEAFALLSSGLPSTETRGSRQRAVYLDFLQRVQKILGLPIVLLCAVGLGSSAIAGMKDRVRVDLPFEMKEKKALLESDMLSSLANSFSAKFFPQPSNASDTPSGANERHYSSEDRPLAEPQDQPLTEASLTGDVYELTVEDARTIAMSNQIPGKIFLTDPYQMESAPFITIPVSDELTRRILIQRPRIM